MREILNDKLNYFYSALSRLKEALNEKESELAVDGTIKRFEFTFEMGWKTVKKFLLYEGIECTSPRDCIKKAYQNGYINHEKEWVEMLNDRNLTSHVYDENSAKMIYNRIKKIYLNEFELLYKALRVRFSEIERECEKK